MPKQPNGAQNFSVTSTRWLPLWVALAAFLLYANTIGNNYALDDGAVISANPYVQQGIKGIPGVFTTDTWHFENADLGYYRPLSLVTFAIETQFFHNNPHVSHLINAILYALSGFLLCLLLLRIFANYNPVFSFIIALLFIAHPIHTEVIANIKSRDEILSFLNLLVATWFLLGATAHKKVSRKLLLSSCLFFYLALLSKETAITGIFLIPAILYFSNSLSAKQVVKFTVPFLVLVLLFQLQKYLALGSVSGPDTTDIVSFPYTGNASKLATAFLSLAWYVKLIFIPYPLSYNYAYNQIPAAEWASIATISGIIISIILIYFSFKNLNNKSPLALGVFIFAAALAPALGFIILKGGVLAERFLYASSLGFCMAITWLGFKVYKLPFQGDIKASGSPVIKLLPFLVVFLLYSFTTVSRNIDWKNDLTLSGHDVKTSPNSCQVHLHYGKKLIDDGVAENDASKKALDFKLGTEQLYAAININPRYSRAYFKLAYAYQALEENDDSAIYYYYRAIDEAPGYALAYNNLGGLYIHLGRIQLATHCLTKALQLNPNLTSARQLLQKLEQGQIKGANENTGDSTISAPATFDSYTALGVKCAHEKNFIDAQKYLLKAIQLKPNLPVARVNLAVCYGMMQEYDKSAEVLNDALKIDPNNKSALQNMVALYKLTGNKVKEQEYRDRLKK